MRNAALCLVLLSVVASPMAAQDNCAMNYRRTLGCGRCGQESCDCASRICPPPCPPQEAPPQMPVAPQQGVFMAPPQNGAVLGESNSVHVQGMEIEFPALRLRLPSLRMPSVFRSRTNARMLINEAEAPFLPAGSMPAMAMPMAVQAPQQRITPEQLQQLLQQLPPQQSPPPCPQQAPVPCTQAAPSPCDAAQLQKIREMERVESQLRERLMRVEQQLSALTHVLTESQLAAGDSAPGDVAVQRIPAPERTGYDVQQTVYQEPSLRRLPDISPPRQEPRRLPLK